MKDKKELSKVISALTAAVNELNSVIAEDDEDTFEPAFAEPAAEDEIEIVDDTPEDADSEEKIEIVDDEEESAQKEDDKKDECFMNEAIGEKIDLVEVPKDKVKDLKKGTQIWIKGEEVGFKKPTYGGKIDQVQADGDLFTIKVTEGPKSAVEYNVTLNNDSDASKVYVNKADEGLGDLLNPLAPIKTVGKIVGGIGNAISGIGESKEECEDGDCDKKTCDEGIGSAVLGGLAMGAASAVGNKVAGKILGEKDCDEEFEDDEVDEGLLNLLNPLAPVKAIGGAIKGLFGEECEDCEEGSKKEAALNEARIADLEDKFGFSLGLKTAYQLFYRNAYILIEPSEIAYDKGCRVIYVDDDQMICLYDEANDVDLYSSYVESDVEVDSQIRQIFQSHLDLYIDEIGDVRVVKGRYHV